MPELRNILVIRLSSLGDVVMTIPAVNAIHDRFPDAHLSWLVEGSVGEFLATQDFISEVIVFQRTAFSNALRKGNLPEAIRIFASSLSKLRQREYDAIIDFHGIAKSTLFSMFVRAKEKVGFGKMFAKEQSHLFYDVNVNGTDKHMHKVERNLLMAHYLGCTDPPCLPALRVSEAAQLYIDNFLSSVNEKAPFLAINPFSSKGTDFKRWPLERYGELILRIFRECGRKSVILWGPGEEKEAHRLKEISGESAFLACPTDISQLYALLKRSSLYIGGDTGVMHLAAAAGIKVLSLFGPTDHRINAPYGNKNIIIKEDVTCSPCKKKNCNDRICMSHITVEKVFGAVDTALERSLNN